MMTKRPRALLTAALIAATAGCAAEAKVTTAPPPPPPPAPPPPPPAPPPKPTVKSKVSKLRFTVNEKGEVELPGPVRFETGTARLRPESDPVLEVVQKYLQAKPEVTKLRIEGHTDTDGHDKSNMTLSKQRAIAVSQWLVAKGIDCRRLVPVGFGEAKLLVTPEDDPEDKAQNRRVMFVNAEIEGKPAGGLPVEGGAPGERAGDPCE